MGNWLCGSRSRFANISTIVQPELVGIDGWNRFGAIFECKDPTRHRQGSNNASGLHFVKPQGKNTQPSWLLQNWMAVAASVLLFVSIAWNVALLRSHSSARDLLAQEVLSSHLRSLIGTHLVDIPSSDQHTVKPWFNGKLNFSPDVRDFARQGFPLVGGRMEYLDDRPVAALIYQRRQHLINLFMWPAASSSSSGYSEMKRRGYNLLSWTRDGMTCWLVSDVQTGELEQFAQLYK